MSFPATYNPASAEDILRYAKWLINKSFMDILVEDTVPETRTPREGVYSLFPEDRQLREESSTNYGDARRKGGLGNLVEEHFFHYKPNSEQEPDFPRAGLELKVSPFEERTRAEKNGGAKYYVAGERLVLTMIDFNERPVEMDLFKSHLWKKCRQILLVYYMRNRELSDNLKYKIKYVGNFTPNEKDLIIIKQDYVCIMQKIASGKAHEISESDTMYLGACTKGSTAAKSIVLQIENKIPAQKRAFCYKTSYMTIVLNERFINAQTEQDSVVSDSSLLEKLGFDGYVQHLINKHIGKTDKELCEHFHLEYTANKSQWINIAFSLLGIKSNQAEELKKANIVVKATRIEENGRIKENTSFPAFRFKELVEESWIDTDVDEDDNDLSETLYSNLKPSTLQLYFARTKFLFVVFKKEHGEYVLKGCQLWNMPFHDLNDTVRSGWEKTREIINNGVILQKEEIKSGSRAGSYIVSNNLPGEKDNPIIHVRPHAPKAYYRFPGYVNGNPAHGNELPDGRWMTTQCFWLNKSYVRSILRDDLK